MQVRKIVAMSALTLCVSGAAADIAVSMLSTTPAAPAGVVGVFRPAGADRHVAVAALPDRQAIEPAAALAAPQRDDAEALPADVLAPDQTARDRTQSPKATGAAVGLVAGILTGGLVGVILGAGTGALLLLFAGIGVAAIPLVSVIFGAGPLGDGIAGGLVGMAAGGLVGLLAVTAPEAAVTALGYLRGRWARAR